jgi:hypothetical protein
MDWLSIIFIVMIVSAVPLGLLARHIALKRVRQIKEAQEAEKKAAWDRIESNRAERLRARLSAISGGNGGGRHSSRFSIFDRWAWAICLKCAVVAAACRWHLSFQWWQ